MSERFIILTGGDGGFGNFGDEILLASWKDFYRPFQKTYSIMIFMMNPPKQPNDGFHYFVDQRSGLENLGLPLDQVQLVHYYGGGYLNSYWMEEKIWLCEVLEERGFDFRKVIFTGQGLGPFLPDQESRIETFFRQAAWIGTREPGRDGPGFIFSFDDSIAFYGSGKKGGWSFIPKRWPRTKIGINLRAEPYADLDRNDLIEPLRKINYFCSSRGYRLKGLCLVENPHYSDQQLFQSLSTEMDLPLKTIPRPADYRKGLTGVSQFSTLITGSYHGALMALYGGVPVIALFNSEYYKNKFSGLREIINNPMFRSLPVEDLSEAHIEQALLSRNRENLSALTLVLLRLQELNQKLRDRIKFMLLGDQRLPGQFIGV